MVKTNAIRLLESKKVEFTLFEYEVNEDELDAITVANKIGVPQEEVFKTLVTQNESNDYFVFCIPGPYELDLKKCAKTVDSKKIEMIKVKELLPLTGYIRGGCSPIGMKKSYTTYIDETAQLFDAIYISAGVRGCQIRLSPFILQNLTFAKFSDIISDPK